MKIVCKLGQFSCSSYRPRRRLERMDFYCFLDRLLNSYSRNCTIQFGCKMVHAVLRRCICARYPAPSCTADTHKQTASHVIVNLDIPCSAEKQLLERSRALTAHYSWHVDRLSCSTGSEAVALIGELAVRWYFLRDKAQVLTVSDGGCVRKRTSLVSSATVAMSCVSECRQG